jgi:hypothetical protein
MVFARDIARMPGDITVIAVMVFLCFVAYWVFRGDGSTKRRNTLKIVLTGLAIALAGGYLWLLSELEIPALPDEPEKLTLFSIEGDHDRWPLLKGRRLHYYPVLGKTEITARAKKREVIAAIKYDLRHRGGHGGRIEPHHALRIENNGQIIDLIICFECGYYELYRNNELGQSGSIGRSAERLINAASEGAGVTLTSKP